jgi:hypothetical protein
MLSLHEKNTYKACYVCSHAGVANLVAMTAKANVLIMAIKVTGN